ncbi:hypothetical protein DFH27DRAFT_524147 [Peziza echinospora]|nr:hypothetical protein DFH27DRAFT_524147 [Peziza echinospora]
MAIFVMFFLRDYTFSNDIMFWIQPGARNSFTGGLPIIYLLWLGIIPTADVRTVTALHFSLSPTRSCSLCIELPTPLGGNCTPPSTTDFMPLLISSPPVEPSSRLQSECGGGFDGGFRSRPDSESNAGCMSTHRFDGRSEGGAPRKIDSRSQIRAAKFGTVEGVDVSDPAQDPWEPDRSALVAPDPQTSYDSTAMAMTIHLGLCYVVWYRQEKGPIG